VTGTVPEGPDGIEVFGAPTPPARESTSDLGDLPPAPPVLRAFAFVLDGIGTFALVVLGVSASLGVSVSHAFWAIWVMPVLVTVVDTVLTAWRGFTPGKAVLGLRVVDVGSGAPPSPVRASLRSLVIAAPALVGAAITWLVARADPDGLASLGLAAGIPVLGWVAMLVVLATRPRHRGLQDLAGRSVVLRVR